MTHLLLWLAPLLTAFFPAPAGLAQAAEQNQPFLILGFMPPRSGVPLYIHYSRGKAPEILPQVLTVSRLVLLAQQED